MRVINQKNNRWKGVMITMFELIALCNAFWMYIYLYGLDSSSSALFNPAHYIFPFILIALAIIRFIKRYKK